MRRLLSPPPVPCPSCGARTPWHYLRGIFDCRACGATLKIHGSYMTLVFLVGMLLALVLAYVVTGFSRTSLDSPFIVPVVIASQLFTLAIAVRLVPPEIDVVSLRSSVLPLGGASPDVRGVRLQPDHATDKPVDVGRGMFQSRRHPFGLEGALVALALLGIFGWQYWGRLQNAVYAVMPGYKAVREGGPGFPATIRIGERSIEIINGSRAPWSCDVSVGRNRRYRARVAVLPGTPSNLPYHVFLAGQESASDRTLRNLAREVVHMECARARGGPSSWSFE